MHRFALFALLVGCGDNAKTEPPVDSPPIAPRCVPTDVREDLVAFGEALSEIASTIETRPGPTEAVGFFVFPRLEVVRPPKFAAVACTDAMTFDPVCQPDGLCTQLECTGVARGWELHLSTNTSFGFDPVYSAATVDSAWIDGETKLTFEIAATSQSGTHDWSFSGSGEMDIGVFSARLTFPSLVELGPLVFGVTGSEGSGITSLTVAGEPAELCD